MNKMCPQQRANRTSKHKEAACKWLHGPVSSVTVKRAQLLFVFYDFAAVTSILLWLIDAYELQAEVSVTVLTSVPQLGTIH